MANEITYQPPFTVSAKAIKFIGDISASLERYKILMEGPDGIRLRKANHIKTLRGTTAIEGNTLTEEEITTILAGKHILAPPYDRVPFLMQDLFDWVENADDHMLIKSCVFHYEFEFIHPFPDGNGRMGRFWQTAILGKWNNLFYSAPVENMIFSHQQSYYNAIGAAGARCDASPFIDFMLDVILQTIKERGVLIKRRKTTQKTTRKTTRKTTLKNAELVLNFLCANPSASIREIAEELGLSVDGVKWNIRKLKAENRLLRIGPDNGGHWNVVK